MSHSQIINFNQTSKKVKLIEVYSDIAGSKKGASLGIEALKKTSKDIDSKFFQKFLSESIKDENNAHDIQSEHKNAKYIDKVFLVISRLASRVKKLREEDFFPIILSGDHASCAGTMHGIKMAHPNEEVGVVYIDAHADIHSPYTSDSGNLHGMPLAMVCNLDNKESMKNNISRDELYYWEKLKSLSGDKPAIKPHNIVFCALRDFEQVEQDIIDANNINVYTVEDITLKGIESCVKNIYKNLSHCDHIYISFDVDSVDPLYIPGTGTPSSGGLSYDQALQLNLELIKNKKVCCWEIAEMNPLYSTSEEDSIKVFNLLEKVTQMLIKNY